MTQIYDVRKATKDLTSRLSFRDGAQRRARNPEPHTQACGSGFRVRAFGAPRNDDRDQPFNNSTSVRPIRAGDGDTLIPADSIAAILDGASPLPPAMMAPAWPMRRPGGAVRPAMKPTIGFLRPFLASS